MEIASLGVQCSVRYGKLKYSSSRIWCARNCLSPWWNSSEIIMIDHHAAPLDPYSEGDMLPLPQTEHKILIHAVDPFSIFEHDHDLCMDALLKYYKVQYIEKILLCPSPWKCIQSVISLKKTYLSWLSPFPAPRLFFSDCSWKFSGPLRISTAFKEGIFLSNWLINISQGLLRAESPFICGNWLTGH